MNSTILIVEDEVSIRNIAQTYPEQEGFRVTCAITARTAWNWRGNFSLV